MTKSQIQTYQDKDNQIIRLSHEKRIFRHFNNTNAQDTIREVARAVNLPYTSTQKRITDLVNKDLLKVVGSISEDGNPNSIYAINRMPEIFRKRKVTKLDLLKQAMRKSLDSGTYDAVIDEFERMKSC